MTTMSMLSRVRSVVVVVVHVVVCFVPKRNTRKGKVWGSNLENNRALKDMSGWLEIQNTNCSL